MQMKERKERKQVAKSVDVRSIQSKATTSRFFLFSFYAYESFTKGDTRHKCIMEPPLRACLSLLES